MSYEEDGNGQSQHRTSGKREAAAPVGVPLAALLKMGIAKTTPQACMTLHHWLQGCIQKTNRWQLRGLGRNKHQLISG